MFWSRIFKIDCCYEVNVVYQEKRSHYQYQEWTIPINPYPSNPLKRKPLVAKINENAAIIWIVIRLNAASFCREYLVSS